MFFKLKKIHFLTTIVLLFQFTTSCIPNKKLIYLRNKSENKALSLDSLISYSTPVYRLQYNDIVEIKIKTTIPEMNAIFGFDSPTDNSVQGQRNQSFIQGAGDAFYLSGYTIDANGDVKLPFIGKVNLKGLDLVQAEAAISMKISTYFKKFSVEDFHVSVKLGGIRFSTLGEFNKPGKYVVLQERLTVLDAIALSGDLTIQAKRNQITLIRQYPEGIKLHSLDVTDRAIIQSPFYFIQPNDQLYVEPMKVREFGTGSTTVQTMSVIMSSISALVLLISLTR